MKDGLRIAMLTETFPPEINGVALSVSHLVDGLREKGHTVELYRPKQASDEGAPPSASTHLFKGVALPRYAGLQFGLPGGRALYRHWRTARPDVVHIATEGPLGFSALRSALSLGIPVVSGFHTNFHRYSDFYHAGAARGLIERYLRWFHNACDITLVPTRDMLHDLQSLNIDNAVILGRGIDTNTFSPSQRNLALRRCWGINDNEPVMISVGRLAAEKNITLIERAYRAIKQERPDTRLVLVGDGPLRASLEARLPDAIFTGVQRGTALAKHYASADFFVFPSLTETFGNVTLEAMASGLAVVAFDYAAARWTIDHGINGLKAPVDNEEAFIAACLSLAHRAPWRTALGVAARTRVLEFDWSDIVDQLVSYYHRSLSQTRSCHARAFQSESNT